MRASNAIYDVDEDRPVRLVATVALFVMLVIAAAIVVLTGPIANQVGTPSAAHNKAYGALATVIVRERPPTHAVRTAGDCAGRQPLPVSPPDEREGARSAATGDKDDNERHNR